MRLPYLALIFVLLSPVQAALVDNGLYTTDTVSGLDWLDLSETAGNSYQYADDPNAGWRHATNAEIESIFAQSFDGYFDTGALNTSISSYGYADQNADTAVFIDLFGLDEQRAIGMYKDEDEIVRFMGAQDNGNYTVVYGLEYSNVYSETSTTSSAIGTWLVRSTVVPIPAAVWLFGSALAGLSWLRRKQTL
jgi:hypothetical protein